MNGQFELQESTRTGDWRELFRLCLTEDYKLSKDEIEQLKNYMNAWLQRRAWINSMPVNLPVAAVCFKMEG